MFAKPERTRVRSVKRKLKAAASILVALAAGTFLACRREEPAHQQAQPGGRDATPDGGSTATAASATAAPPGEPSAAAPSATASAPASPSAASSAIVSAKPKTPPPPTVDKREHRKGMPVRDNLLE
jgi:hypothetical protein